MTAQEKELVEDAIALLKNSTDDPCHCGEKTCSIDTPQCRAMEVCAAEKSLRDMIDAPPKTLHPLRLQNPAERIFFEQWCKENSKCPGINSGYSALEWILCPEGQKHPDRPSHRDAEVAATVIQWLGTSCGGSFIHQCEDKIKAERIERSDLEYTLSILTEPRERDLFERLLDKILKDLLPNPKTSPKGYSTTASGLAHLRSEIAYAMRMMFALFAVETGKVSIDETCDGASEWYTQRFKKLLDLARRSVDKRKVIAAKKTKKVS